MLIIELCSGYGQTIYQNAIKIDIDKTTKPNIIADVRHLPLRQDLQPDILILSPPCTFTTKADWSFPRPGIRESFDVIGACLESVSWLKPKMWILETPIGHLQKFIPSEKVKLRWKSGYDIIQSNADKKISYLFTNKRSKLRSHIKKLIGVD